MEPVRFESKVDMWLVAIVVASFALPVVLGISRMIRSGFDRQVVPLLIVLIVVAPSALLTGFIFTNTYYVVTDESIVAHCLFRTTVPLASVKRLRPTRNPLSSPALSLDRIEIVSNSGARLLVSPKDKEAFVNAIVTRAPQAVVEGWPSRR
jgi:hypothetical protein